MVQEIKMGDPLSIAGLQINSGSQTGTHYSANTASGNVIQVNGNISNIEFERFFPAFDTREGLQESSGNSRIFVYQGKQTSASKPVIDIVAVHGFNADEIETWGASNGCVWLRDLLPNDIPDARIMSYNYSVRDKGTVSIGSVENSARDLLQALIEVRQSEERGKRPIIFICHGFGGNLVEQALALTVPYYTYKSILKRTRGVIFFGTSQKLSSGLNSSTLIELGLFDDGEPWKRYSPFSRDLLKKTQQYREEFQGLLLKSKSTISIISLYEDDNIRTNDGYTQKRNVIVFRKDAILNTPDEVCYGIDADHADLCKFNGRDDEHYKIVLKELQRITDSQRPNEIGLIWQQGILVDATFDSLPIYPPGKAPYTLEAIPEDEGAHGVVHQAKTTRGEPVAIKIIRHVHDPENRKKVLNEVKLLKESSHPNVLRLVDAYQVTEAESTFYLVTSPWAPRTLFTFIQEYDRGRQALYPWFELGNPVSEVYIYRIFQGLVSGLSHIHGRKVKHKDIKPENILLSFDEGRGEGISWVITPIIADLGLSKDFSSYSATNYTDATRKYLAPEQLSHTESTIKADIFALGCCFVQVLAVLHEGSAGLKKIEKVVNERKHEKLYGKAWKSVQDELGTFDVHGKSVSRDVISCVKTMLDKNLEIRPDVNEVEGHLRDCDMRALNIE